MCPYTFMSDMLYFLRADYNSFSQITREKENANDPWGRMAVGQIATATAAIDSFGWLIFDPKNSKNDPIVAERFKRLIQAGHFHPEMNHELVWKIIRNGVVHEFFVKAQIPLISATNCGLFFQDSHGETGINSLEFMAKTIKGLDKALQDIQSCGNPHAIASMSQRLIDRLSHQNSEFDIAQFAGSHPLPVYVDRTTVQPD